MPYTQIFTITDEHRTHVRSALYDSAYDYHAKMLNAIEKGNKWDVRVYAEKYFRAQRAIEAMAYTCDLPVFTKEEMSYDGSDDTLANIVKDMEPYESEESNTGDGYCSCGLTYDQCSMNTSVYEHGEDE